MTIRADSKKRVVIPGIKPGDVFVCEQPDADHFFLARLPQPPSPKSNKITREQVRRALKDSKLKFDTTWEELRQMTREA